MAWASLPESGDRLLLRLSMVLMRSRPKLKAPWTCEKASLLTCKFIQGENDSTRDGFVKILKWCKCLGGENVLSQKSPKLFHSQTIHSQGCRLSSACLTLTLIANGQPLGCKCHPKCVGFLHGNDRVQLTLHHADAFNPVCIIPSETLKCELALR